MPNDVKSCGCQKEEKDRQRDFRTQRATAMGAQDREELKLADGRTVTVTELQRLAGVHKRVMARRVALWPEQRWLEPPHYVGKRDRRELIDRKNRERQTPRPQPWARAIMQQIKGYGRAYRKVKHERCARLVSSFWPVGGGLLLDLGWVAWRPRTTAESGLPALRAGVAGDGAGGSLRALT